MQFRHEVKHELAQADLPILRQRLKAIMRPDEHAINGVYSIRSLYFDNDDDKALREKLNGVNIREKYRIRLYNNDTSFISLERKFKCGQLGFKESVRITESQALAAACGDISWMGDCDNELLKRFRTHFICDRLVPKVLVDYTREPYIFDAGEVRVTLDYALRTSHDCRRLLEPDCVTIPAKYASCILEVKWNEFLPDIVRGAVQLGERSCGAFSKYAACRMYE